MFMCGWVGTDVGWRATCGAPGVGVWGLWGGVRSWGFSGLAKEVIFVVEWELMPMWGPKGCVCMCACLHMDGGK